MSSNKTAFPLSGGDYAMQGGKLKQTRESGGPDYADTDAKVAMKRGGQDYRNSALKTSAGKATGTKPSTDKKGE